MNALSQQTQEEILILAESGYSFREIAKKLHIKRHTVSQYAKTHGIIPRKGRFKGAGKPPLESTESELSKELRSDKISKASEPALYHQSFCEPHRDWITQQVKFGRNGMSIYQDLVEQFGFSHKYDSVKSFVRKLKEQTPKRAPRKTTNRKEVTYKV